jgi:hypothetical protein
VLTPFSVDEYFCLIILCMESFVSTIYSINSANFALLVHFVCLWFIAHSTPILANFSVYGIYVYIYIYIYVYMCLYWFLYVIMYVCMYVRVCFLPERDPKTLS